MFQYSVHSRIAVIIYYTSSCQDSRMISAFVAGFREPNNNGGFFFTTTQAKLGQLQPLKPAQN